MIFITSISPKHTNMQQQIDAVNSWMTHGKVISVNHPSEIEALSTAFKDVDFREALRTAKPKFDKHYVYIDQLIDIGCSYDEPVMLINSDIEITQDKEIIDIIKNYDGKACVYLHRWDYENDKSNAVIYRDGVDAILLQKNKVHEIPSTLYFMGATHWDLWYPISFYKTKTPIVCLTSKPVIYHKKHPFQYSKSQWDKLGKHASWLEDNPDASSEQITRGFYRMLRAATEYI